MAISASFGGCAGHIDEGTGGTGGGAACVPSGSGTATFAMVREAFRGSGPVESCSSSPCHPKGAEEPPPPRMPLVLADDANLYANVTSYVSAACGNIPFVNPGKPDQSGLIKILQGPCGTTSRMPFGCSAEQCYADDTIAMIADWIASCAPNN
jgi:hypothetical protein